jgi:hypothetical protein
LCDVVLKHVQVGCKLVFLAQSLFLVLVVLAQTDLDLFLLGDVLVELVLDIVRVQEERWLVFLLERWFILLRLQTGAITATTDKVII